MTNRRIDIAWQMAAMFAFVFCLLAGILFTTTNSTNGITGAYAQGQKNSHISDQTHKSPRLDSKLKVGFICDGPVSDLGWNYAHDQGRLYLEKQLPGQVQTVMAEKIPENSEAERVLEKMVAQGCKLIFMTSYGYLEPGMRVALRHPDVTFMAMNRFKTAKNLGTYFSYQYEPMYLAGMVAGRMTKSNQLGYLLGHAVPPMLQSVNSFTLGAQAVNPKVTTHAVLINSWSDPALESEAINGLKEMGCDVIAHGQDNPLAILPKCESLGLYSVGAYADGHTLAPKDWLTGASLDWGPFYVKIAKQVIDHKWKPCVYTSGLEGDYVKLSSFGKVVSESVKKEVLAKEQLIKQGKFAIFQGPMKDKDGKERIAPGEKLSPQQLEQMTWVVPGVNGSLPKPQPPNNNNVF